MKNWFYRIKQNSILFTAILLSLATISSFILFHLVHENQTNVALLYILALIIISRYTPGYIYGIVSSFLCVFLVNLCFTYPYFKVNFLLKGYPITFIEMLSISIITSTTTSHMIKQSKEIAERDRQLMEAEKEKMRANLLRAVSHDLRTPLTGIIGTTSSLMENSSSLTEKENKELIENIYNDSNWLLNMVENLLSVTRIQNNASKVKKSMEMVEEVASESVTRLKKRIHDAKIYVTVPDELLMIPMDAMLIEQVIINLLENAFIHSQSQKPIEFHINSSEHKVIFCIKDYGIGIDEEKMEDIFNGIPTDTSQIADSRKGMGIGLSICKTIILAHNGTLIARNHEDGGSEFIFELPKEDLNYE